MPIVIVISVSGQTCRFMCARRFFYKSVRRRPHAENRLSDFSAESIDIAHEPDHKRDFLFSNKIRLFIPSNMSWRAGIQICNENVLPPIHIVYAEAHTKEQ
jgi:hypothetical protein